MAKIRNSLAAALAFAVFSSGPGFAAPTQKLAWVSKQFGNDDANCGAVSTPCKTFQFAHDNVVASGGTIFVRDPGGYGTLVISKGISIINEGDGVASISAASLGDGIKVAAGAADVVLIKGVTIDGAGAGANGIKVQSAGTVTIADCTVKGFKESGIFVGSATAVNFGVVDSLITDNRYNVWVQPAQSASHAGFLKNVVTTRGEMGVYADGKNTSAASYIALSLEGGFAAHNTTAGFRIMSAVVTARSVRAELNGAGVVIDFGSIVLSRSQFMSNKNYDVSVFGAGKVFSSGDNLIDNFSGSPTPFNYR